MGQTIRAAVYLRISLDKTGEAAGVQRQREDCLALVESQGWTLHEVYEDNDISASTGKVRPGYRRLLEDVRAGHIDAIVAWHPDRLYRKLTDLEGLIAAIESRNVTMRTVRAGEIDLSTPTGRMLARILSATAQAEGEVKADRWRRSWRQGREQGKPVALGSRVFGYARDGKTIVPHEAAIARQLADDVLAGVSLESLARDLQDRGITGTRGGVWRATSIRKYLFNPQLAGFSTLNGEIVGSGDWQPIIDPETWEALRAMLEVRHKAPTNRVALLNGLIFCGICDCRMVTSQQRPKTRAYRCPTRGLGFVDACGRCSGSAEPIEEIVESYARARLSVPEVRQRIAELRATPGNERTAVADLELRIAELERQLDSPGVPVATVLRAIDRAKARQEELLGHIASTQPVPIPTGDEPWPTDLKRRRALVDLVVERVVLNKATKPSRYGFDPERVDITER